MEHPSFIFELGREAVAEPARWTRGSVRFGAGSFDLEAHLWRSGGQGFMSAHSLALRLDANFTAECFVGVLQHIADAGFGASTGHFSTTEETDLSADQSTQVDHIYVNWVLGQDCRSAVPHRALIDVPRALKRISILERLGASVSFV